MRALVCHAYGPIDSLKIEDIPQPVPKAGEVLVRVRAAGVSFAVMLGVQGKHQNKPPMPYVPGNELAGHVVALGEGVTNVAVGDRVATGVSQGGFAEYAVATAANLIPIPEQLPYAEATNFPTLYPTAYGALRWKAAMQPGEVLLVHGAGGGSGLTAIEVGKAMGATVIASAGGAEVEWLDVPWDAFRLTGFDAVRLTALDYPLTGMHVVATTRPNLFARELVDAKYMVPRGLLLMVNDEGLAVFPDDQPWDDDGHPKALGQFRLDPRQFSSHDQAQATAATLTDAGYLVDLSAAPLPLTT